MAVTTTETPTEKTNREVLQPATDIRGKRWVSVGQIVPKKKGANLTNIPREPGLYKVVFQLGGKTYNYIGATGNLHDRMGNYCNNPTKDTIQEHVYFELFSNSGSVDVFVCRVGTKEKTERQKLERDAILTARKARLYCVNRGLPQVEKCPLYRRRYLETRVNVFKAMLAAAKTELAQL